MATTAKKFYFSRRQSASIMAQTEDEARLQLEEAFGMDVEDFILDDVRDMIEIGGEWKVLSPTHPRAPAEPQGDPDDISR